MKVPMPTPIFRFLHVDNLQVCLRRRALHAPNQTPSNGLSYKIIHNEDIQQRRSVTCIPCGPRGTIHDYVSFYFGPRSPMLFQLCTGRVDGYTEGQEPLIYIVSTVQAISQSDARFVFSDGHGIATFTQWFDDLSDLQKVDWDAVYATMWSDTVDDMDRQRRKQAEYLIYQQCDWGLIQELGVLNMHMKTLVEHIVGEFPAVMSRPVKVRPEWYY